MGVVGRFEGEKCIDGRCRRLCQYMALSGLFWDVTLGPLCL